MSNSATRLRDPDDAAKALGDRADVRVLWSAERRPISKALGLSPVREALRQCLLTEPEAFAVAIIDSALRTFPLDAIDLALIAKSLPPSFATTFARVDPRADTGTESVIRVLLWQVGIHAMPQVRIPFSDLGRLDLLVGDRLVIECDSEAHHGGRDARLRDLKRDTALASLGFIVLRFDYTQVMFDPESVLSAVLAYVDAGLHLS